MNSRRFMQPSKTQRNDRYTPGVVYRSGLTGYRNGLIRLAGTAPDQWNAAARSFAPGFLISSFMRRVGRRDQLRDHVIFLRHRVSA